MSETKIVNPFYHLPKYKLEIIRKDFEEGSYRSNSFEEHLKSLHADELIPEEVLDIIESRNSCDWKTMTLDEFLKELRKQ